jgi:hypothetical protein
LRDGGEGAAGADRVNESRTAAACAALMAGEADVAADLNGSRATVGVFAHADRNSSDVKPCGRMPRE